jgi:hypothetical protein
MNTDTRRTRGRIVIELDEAAITEAIAYAQAARDQWTEAARFLARAAMQSINANSGKTRAEVEAERHTELMGEMIDRLREIAAAAGARWG